MPPASDANPGIRRRPAPGLEDPGSDRPLRHPAARRALLVAGVALGLLVVLHTLQNLAVRNGWSGPLDSYRLSLGTDRGLPELWGYLVVATLVAALVAVGRAAPGNGVLLAWAGVFAVVLVDDAVGLHERGGTWLADHVSFGGPFGIEDADLGELVTWAMLFVVPSAAVAVVHRRSPARTRHHSWRFGVLFLVLVFCGVGIDVVHQGLDEGGWAWWAVGTLEDGGELAVLSVAAAYAIGLGAPREAVPPSARPARVVADVMPPR